MHFNNNKKLYILYPENVLTKAALQCIPTCSEGRHMLPHYCFALKGNDIVFGRGDPL
jgi:hypothetical protein